jgi:uncharacterized protein (DUF1015 family)
MWVKWSVIACDQHTSEVEYWHEASGIVGDAPSTLNLMLPEAYLETDEAETHKDRIRAAMADPGVELRRFGDVLVYVERTLHGVGVRRGVVGRLDLERYDYTPGSKSVIRPTEQTVVDRLPPRVKVREKARYELPHTMVFANAKGAITGYLASQKEKMEKLYDFELMLGGGHLCGWLVDGEILEKVTDMIAEYEASVPDGAMAYAVGDGNHSLAAAKVHYDATKGIEGHESARYTLCEIVDVTDEAIVFEPIYRRIKTLEDPEPFFRAFFDMLEKEATEITGSVVPADRQWVTTINDGVERTFVFNEPDHSLVVGTVQNLIDRFAASYPGTKVDYIHGADTIRRIGKRPGRVGFLYKGVAKQELFEYVEKNGVLPKKAFSMGDSLSKRYYTELRQIKK